MTQADTMRQTTRLYFYTLGIFAVMQVIAIVNGGVGAQEPFEVYHPASVYAPELASAGASLRLMLALDLLFMIGYGSAIGLTAWLFSDRFKVMGWLAGIGILSVVMADLIENLHMLMSLELVVAGQDLTEGRIVFQAFVSGLKWFLAALTLVALSFILPRDTILEKTLIWLARITMPVGAALFVTGALDLRLAGGVLILAGMGGGLGLLSIVMHLRCRQI